MIINFLVKALCEKESVYVNNLGLFRKEYAPAQIKDGMITPPGYKLVYDPDYDGNGFAFTMFVSQKGGMLITEATTQIDQWVAQLKTALVHNKSVSFGNFGSFSKNDNGVISFVCDRIAELNVEYEGMEPVSLDSKNVPAEVEEEEEVEVVSETEEISAKTSENFEKEKASEEDSTHTEKNDVSTEAESESDEVSEEGENTKNSKNTEHSDNTEDTKNYEDSENTEDSDNENKSEEEEDENDEEDDEDETDDQKRKKRPWLVILIIVLIVALLAAAAYYFRGQLTELYQQYFGPKNTEQVTEAPLTDTLTTIAIDTIATDSLNVETDSLSMIENSENIEEKTVSEQTMVNQLPGGEKFFIDYEKGKYYVIVGSFRSEKEVREHIKSRKLEQYNPKVVLQPNSKNMRICIGVFDTESAADNFGRTTRLNYWVLK